MYKTALCLTIFAIVTITSGCANTRPASEFIPPARPIFTEYSSELWRAIPIEAQENIVTDDLACKQYIRETESRATIHNEKR